MSLVIKGMEMPLSCSLCPFTYVLGDWIECRATRPPTCTRNYDERMPECPLVEVPPHGRLIDADSLKEQLSYYIKEAGWGEKTNEALTWVRDDFIDAERTIIPAEEG